MEQLRRKLNHWLLPWVLCLFLALVVLLPLVVGYAYAGGSRGPDHVLTYSRGKLTWDSSKDIRPDGTAEMELFFPEYDDSVLSGNGDDIAAPGTGSDYFLRLRNTVSGPIRCTAVLYAIKSDPLIPLEARLVSENFEETATYQLPEGVSADMVLHAVSGVVSGQELQDFTVEWAWQYFVSDEQDKVDTDLGNKEPLDKMTLGLYVVVEDTNTEDGDTPPTQGDDPDDSPVTPQPPSTGDESPVAMYLTLLVISGLVLILLLIDRRREKKREST